MFVLCGQQSRHAVRCGLGAVAEEPAVVAAVLDSAPNTPSFHLLSTVLQLAVEDHRWWWRSFLCGGSTAMFVYGYCFYYFYARSGMSGFMQTSFFFGYNAMVRAAGRLV
jgi:hypothetical protein